MDLATLIGLVLGFGLVGMAIMLGGSIGAFIDVPSILIVVAGTLSITTVSFTLKEVIKGQGLLLKTVLFSVPAAPDEAKMLIELAQKARANGLLAIQGDVDAISDDFLKNSLTMAVDGSPPEVIEQVMKTDTANMMERHISGVQIFKKSAEVAPAMGLIGTLIGLVQMLGNLDDPSKIGPAMAVALLTTMYGAILANMVFSPMAAKLERNSAEEIRLRKIYTTSVLSIVKQENPRQLELVVNTILPPSDRISVFD
ncbi:MAG: MotA/TolQ/ExbB proton channel family protein [Alphaproteobacteria bacterium]|nr:MotA/TolQ/ExbB proton channel family protein [Alphaproteobacteria bacterium]MDD9919161.1 MotA/TolQ/ExbB proton channel family protein [Alphaproteobacteria bacterium]